jgi:hypothetical protein
MFFLLICSGIGMTGMSASVRAPEASPTDDLLGAAAPPTDGAGIYLTGMQNDRAVCVI